MREESARTVPRDQVQVPTVGRGEEDEVSDEGAAVGARALRQGRVGEIIAVVLSRDAERGAGGQIECRV